MKRDGTGRFINNWTAETKQRVSLSLTRTAWQLLDEEAQRLGLSRSELIERYARQLNSSVEPAVKPAVEPLGLSLELPVQPPSLPQQATQMLSWQMVDLFEMLPEALICVDQSWCCTWINSSAELLLNTLRAALLGHPIWKVLPFLVNTQSYARCHQALLDQQPIDYEEFFPTCGRWFAIRLYPSPHGLFAWFCEVTERKHTETALAQTQERLQLALSSARMIAWDVDLQTNRVVCSAHASKLWGIHEGSITDFLATVHPEDRHRVFQAAEAAITGNGIYAQEYRIVCPDGTVSWLNSQGRIYFDHNKPIRMIGVSVDVTEQVRSRQQIEALLAEVQQKEARQRFFAESSRVLASSLDYQTTLTTIAKLIVPALADWCTVYIVDETGITRRLAVTHASPEKVAWANEISRRYPHNPHAMTGVAQVIRTGKSELYAEITDDWLVQAAQDADHLNLLRQIGFTSAMIVPLQIQNRTLGAISFVAAESGRRYTEADLALAEGLGRRAALAVENAQLYQAVERDRSQAEAANRIKDEFLAVLSHELRSPLNPILGWAKLLQTQQFDAATVDRALKTIERNARLQAQLVEDLLDVSRILQGKMVLNVAAVDLVATIEAALESIALAADAKQIQLSSHLSPVSPICGDANRLQQVFWNLLSNAVKFTPAGGRIEVRLQQVDRFIQIQVQDTGKGIKTSFLPHVFESFRQEDGSITREFGGLGLGLAIVRHLTELHGGRVQVSSPGENCGTTFTIMLPLLNTCSIQPKLDHPST